jgi:phosphoadenosine phosphosulfate reductase
MSGSLALVVDLKERFGSASADAILTAALTRLFPGRTAVVSSFGAESAVLLHMVAAIDRATPVLFIDTGRHFRETLAYRDALVDLLQLQDVRTIGPRPEDVARRDALSCRAAWDPDGCCDLRKVAPLARALASFDAWVTGRKRFQAATRSGLGVFERDGSHIKVNPLARWTTEDVTAYAETHRLPPHPLVARGYGSIGCIPCTTVVQAGEDQRAGRWRGTDKTECGIHRSPAFQAPPPDRAAEG